MNKLNKVAEITLLFWLMKIIATTLGETFGDYISMTLNLGYALSLAITAVVFGLTIILQLKSNSFDPIKYWIVIIATTTLGTEISDFIDRSLNLGYSLGSILLLSCLSITLYYWNRKFNSLKVFPILSREKELYYWLAILFSNSLGTAFGDYLSDVAEFSYLQGAIITSYFILIVLLLHYASKINAVLLFWLAFIFTRPFGATFGDFLTKPISNGGLDLGTLNASIVSAGLLSLLILLTYIQLKRKRRINKISS